MSGNRSKNQEEYSELVLIRGKCGSEEGELKWAYLDDGLLYGPVSFAIDKGRNIYIVDVLNDRIVKFDSSGECEMNFTPENGGQVNDIVLDKEGKLYILYYKPQILVYDSLEDTLPKRFIIGNKGEAQGCIEISETGCIYVQSPDNPLEALSLSSDDGEFYFSEYDCRFWVETAGTYYQEIWRRGISTKLDDKIYNARNCQPVFSIKEVRDNFTIVGIDSFENFYATTTSEVKNDGFFRLLKINSNGKVLADFTIKEGFSGCDATRTIRIDTKGNVYVLNGSTEGFTLWKYESTHRVR